MPANIRCTARRGITLIEAMIAITIAAMASAALLLAVESALSTSTDSADRAIAEGLAQQLLDEIAEKRFVEPGVAADFSGLGPNAGELALPGRSGFDDTDDYHNFSATPLQGVYGETLGTGDDAGAQRLEAFHIPTTYFSRWRHKVSVYFVSSTSYQRLASGTSFYRCIEVTVEQKDASGNFIPLATKRRVIAYVPPATS